MGDMSSASEALKRALALSHESCDRHGEAKCLIAFGELYRDIWATRRASEHIERALSISIELQVLSLLAVLVLEEKKSTDANAPARTRRAKRNVSRCWECCTLPAAITTCVLFLIVSRFSGVYGLC